MRRASPAARPADAHGRRGRGALLAVVLLAALAGEATTAVAQQKPEPVPALLPDKSTIPPGPPTPIDGVWRIDSLGARVRIEGGRIYAVDPWIHMFVFKVMPGQVVTKDVVRTAPGRYQGEDLPNMGLWAATLNDNQQLEVTIKAKLAPLQLVLTSIMPDSPQALRRERAEQIGAGSSPGE